MEFDVLVPNCVTLQPGMSRKRVSSGKGASICSSSHTGGRLFLETYSWRMTSSALCAASPQGNPKITSRRAVRSVSPMTVFLHSGGTCSKTSEATTASKKASSNGSAVADATIGGSGHLAGVGKEMSHPVKGTLRKVPSPLGPAPTSRIEPFAKSLCWRRMG